MIADKSDLDSLRKRLSQIEQELNALGYQTSRCVNHSGARIANQLFGDEVLILVLFGRLRSESSDQVIVLGPGDRLSVPSGVPFSLEVLGETSAYWIQAHRPDSTGSDRAQRSGESS